MGTHIDHGEICQSLPPRTIAAQPAHTDGEIFPLLERAHQALGRLDVYSFILPSKPTFFSSIHVNQEALLSSQIEGTQSTLSDLLLFDIKEVFETPQEDVMEVVNYISAINKGLEEIRSPKGPPISNRLILEMHDLLMFGPRGKDKQPGEFRRSQNWIGGTHTGNVTFVPPPADKVAPLMSDLDKFIHAETPSLPALVKISLIHLQFETIHPFLDGNGRLGRLLIILLLCSQGILKEPILYLSLYFKRHQDRYYELLQQAHERDTWEDWISFFLSGILETSEHIIEIVQKLLKLFEADRDKIKKLGRPASSALQVYALLQKRPFITIGYASKELNLSPPTVGKSVVYLQKLKILEEYTGKKRGRVFFYKEYFKILTTDTQALG